jgi:hypothetical protein
VPKKRIRISITCPVCFTKFLAKPTEIRRGGGQYCSRTCMGLGMRIPIEVRFQKYLSDPNEHGCILWVGPKTPNGYGLLGDGRNANGNPNWVRSHQLAWRFAYGALPPKGVEIMHTCDHFYPAGDITYRRCVNVAHLELGTHEENMAHMAAADRNKGTRGENSHLSKLTEKDVRWIRRLYANGQWTMKRLGERFGITIGNVHAIVHRRSWDHVK